MDTTSADPRIEEFAADCRAAGYEPLDIVVGAGLHRSAWFRWQSGRFNPNFKKWDAVQRELERVRGQRQDAAA